MEPIELLKKLKSIEADPHYIRTSRMAILESNGNRKTELSVLVMEITKSVLRSGWSMALTAVLLLLTVGSFSVLKIISPTTTAVVDLSGLRAEAQAIDIQINLMDVAYNSPSEPENKTSAPSAVLKETQPEIKSAEVAAEENELSASSTVEEENPVDSALDALAK